MMPRVPMMARLKKGSLMWKLPLRTSSGSLMTRMAMMMRRKREIIDVEGPVEDIKLIDDGITPPEVAAGEKREVRDTVERVLLHRPLRFAARDTP